MFGLGNVLGSFGTIPDIIMGKKPEDALLDNIKAAAIVGTGMYLAPQVAGLLGSGAAGGSVAAEAAGAAPVMESGTAAAFGPTVTGPVPSAYSLLNAPPVGSSMGIGGGLPPAAPTSSATGLLGDTMGMVKNASTVMNAANQANQLAGGNQPKMPITPSPVATPMPNNNLGQMVSAFEQQQMAQQQMEQQARLAKRKLYGYGAM